MPRRALLYGLLAEFEKPEQLMVAAHRAREAGYRRMDAYTPFPVEGLAQALGRKRTMVPLITLIGGLLGGSGGFAMQYWISKTAYPIDVGGRPFNSWPAFIPVTFELTILCASLSAVLGMLALNGLPMPHHPLFNEPRFALASRDRFFLCVESRDRQFDRAKTREFLEGLSSRAVMEVENL
ncbi:MAG: DUF3341 domain-containing protein [Candidatus Acidiferrales bacterium]